MFMIGVVSFWVVMFYSMDSEVPTNPRVSPIGFSTEIVCNSHGRLGVIRAKPIHLYYECIEIHAIDKTLDFYKANPIDE